MRIATWNVNSLKARMPRVEEWLGYAQPDVLCLQETKLADKAFPAMAFSAFYDRKLVWLDSLHDWLAATQSPEQSVAVLGDFNVAPDDRDVWSVKAFAGDDYETAVFYPEDDRYLVERDLKSEHYEVARHAGPEGR